MNTLRKTVARLIAQHGGVRAAAKAVDIDHAYLWRLHVGAKGNPSAETLKKLGLELAQKVTYVKAINK